MRLLFVNTLYAPDIGGGAEITLHSIVKGMAGRGHEVAAVATYSGKTIEHTTHDGIDVFRVPIQNFYWHFKQENIPAWQRLRWHARDSYNPAMSKVIGDIIEQFKPDLISCHNLQGISVSAWRAAKAKKIPIMQVLHDYYSLCPKVTMFKRGKNCEDVCGSCRVFRLPHPALSNQLNAVVGVSRFILQQHLQEGMFKSVPIKQTIYNARTLVPPKINTRRTDAFTFGFIGGLTPVKGITELITAFKQLAKMQSRPVRLLVAGTGKPQFTAELKTLAEDFDIEFLGQVKPEAFFPQLDVAVVPSMWREPLAGVVFEALGYGVPAIGSTNGGIKEIIQHEKNGLLFAPEKSDSLVDALRRLVADNALFESMRAYAKESVAMFLDADRMLREYEALCTNVIEKNNGAAAQSQRTTFTPLIVSRSD